MKLYINLLPKEVLLEREHSSKLSQINKVSVGILIGIILITSLTLFLKISQNAALNRANEQFKASESKVVSFKVSEEQAFALKTRLASIQALLGGDEKRKNMFSLIVYLTPKEVTLYDVIVDKNGNISATFSSPSLVAIETLLSSLSSRETNANLISKVNMEGLSLGKDSVYRFGLKITATATSPKTK